MAGPCRDSDSLYSELQFLSMLSNASSPMSPRAQNAQQPGDMGAGELSDESEFSLLSSMSSASVASLTSGIGSDRPRTSSEPRSPMDNHVEPMDDFSQGNSIHQGASTLPSLPSSASSNAARFRILARFAAARRQKVPTDGDAGLAAAQEDPQQEQPSTPPQITSPQRYEKVIPDFDATPDGPANPTSHSLGQPSARPSPYSWDWQARPEESLQDEGWALGTAINPSSSLSTLAPSFTFDIPARPKDSDTEGEADDEAVQISVLSSKTPTQASVQVATSPSPPPSTFTSVATVMPMSQSSHQHGHPGDDDKGTAASPAIRTPFHTIFRDDSEPEDDDLPDQDEDQADQMLDLGDELSRVIDRLIASTKFMKTSSPSQPCEQPKAEEQKDPSPLHFDDRWQPSADYGIDDQDEIVIAPSGMDGKGKRREDQLSVLVKPLRAGQPPVTVTCETESELSSSSSDCESVQATLFISEAPSPPLARSHIPLITYEPAPVAFNSLKPGRSLASIMEDMHASGSKGTLSHAIEQEPAESDPKVHATWDTGVDLGRVFRAKSTTGATCGGSVRSLSPPSTVPSPKPPVPASAPVTYLPFDFRKRPSTLGTPDTVQSPLTQPSPRSTPSPYMTAVRDGPRVRILEGGVTFPGVSSSSSSSWGTLTRSPTPGLTGTAVHEDHLAVEPVAVPQHDNPLFIPGEPAVPSTMEFGIPPAPTNLPGMQPPLASPWGPIGTPWSWNQFTPCPGQPPISNHPTGPPPLGWGCRQPGPMPWSHIPPSVPLNGPVIPGHVQAPKTPWQGHCRPSLSRGLSGNGPGAGGYPDMDPSHPSGYPHASNPSQYPFFPPAPLLGPTSLPWATSSLPQRSVTLPAGQATPGMGFNVGYPWQTPGPITGFSPPSGPSAPPPASFSGWTPRTTQHPTGGATSFNTGSRDVKWDGGAPQPPSVSSRFSFSDATVCFSVQGKEYYVHRHFFEKHSPFFEKLLSSFPLHSEWPIPLQQVSQIAFERLLSIFYPLDLSSPTELATVEEWTSILELSTFWDFKQLRSRSIKELTDITSPIDRIVLAQTFNVPEWTLSGYRALVMRRKPVTTEEAERLGMQAVLKVWQVQTDLNSRTHLCPGACCLPLVDGLVRAEFGLA